MSNTAEVGGEGGGGEGYIGRRRRRGRRRWRREREGEWRGGGGRAIGKEVNARQSSQLSYHKVLKSWGTQYGTETSK